MAQNDKIKYSDLSSRLTTIQSLNSSYCSSNYTGHNGSYNSGNYSTYKSGDNSSQVSSQNSGDQTSDDGSNHGTHYGYNSYNSGLKNCGTHYSKDYSGFNSYVS